MTWSVLVVVFMLTVCHAFIQCPPNYCDKVECNKGVTEEFCAEKRSVLMPKSSLCGCCDSCIKHLSEGDGCFETLFLGTYHPATCGEDLRCDPKSLLCVKVQERDQSTGMLRKSIAASLKKRRIMIAPRSMKLIRDVPPPARTSSGLFQGRQCDLTGCFCVDEYRNRIPGYDTARRKIRPESTCACARELERYRKTGRLGRSFRCDGSGDYEYLQCMGSTCYCVDPFTGELRVETRSHISTIGKMRCVERQTLDTKRCMNNRCYCVDKHGRDIAGFEFDIQDSPDIPCRCAQEADAYRQTGLIGKMFSCDQYGSYNNIQCMGSVCFCADQLTGKRVGVTVANIWEIEQLNC